MIRLILIPFISSMIILLSFEREEIGIDERLHTKATPIYLQNHINSALQNGESDIAMMYINLAISLDIEVDKAVIEEVNRQNSFSNKAIKNTKEFFSGFISGSSISSVGLSGSVISDMMIVGDIRDIYREGGKFTNDESYDKFTLQLAIIGVALSATTYISLGATSGAKVGVSILKVAKKTNSLSNGFIGIINKRLNKSVDFKVLKTLNFSSILSIKSSKEILYKSINLKPINALLSNLSSIKKSTNSLEDTVSIIKYVNNSKDLKKVINISKRYKKNTKAVFIVLGKGALRGSKSVVKFTKTFVFEFISLIISTLLLLIFTNLLV